MFKIPLRFFDSGEKYGIYDQNVKKNRHMPVSHNPDIPAQLDRVLTEIRNSAVGCGRNPADILLVAVSKTKPLEAILQAHAAGQVHFGENKVQELVPKMEDGPADAVWHMIGAIAVQQGQIHGSRGSTGFTRFPN